MSSEEGSRRITPLPEAGNDAEDPNIPLSEERDTPPPPMGNPHQDQDDIENEIDNISDDESELSDVDEAQFQDFDPANVEIDDRPAIAVDESNIGVIGVHKRKRADGEGGSKKKDKKSRREKSKKSRKKVDNDVALSGGEETEGLPARKAKPQGKEVSRARKASPDKEEELSPEERRRRALDRAMDEALKAPNRRRRKKDGEDLEFAADAMIENMRQRMVAAAQADNEARQAGKIAMQKLKMLPEVISLLNRNNLQHAVVDPEANLLEAVKFFLEPLSDGSLPAFNIQRDVFGVLAKLPINRDSLVASGIGKVILFYTKSKKAEPNIRRQAERLLGDWSRPILKRTDDYRKRQLAVADYDPTKLSVHTSSQPYKLSQEEARAQALAPPVRTNRARLQGAPKSYSVVPRSVLPAQNAFARPMGAGGDDTFRRMKARQLGKAGGDGRR